MFYSHVCTRVLTNPILCPAVILPRQMMLRLLRRSQQDVASKSRRGQRNLWFHDSPGFFYLFLWISIPISDADSQTKGLVPNSHCSGQSFPWKHGGFEHNWSSPKSSVSDGIFREKNHPAFGVPPFMETPHMSHPWISISKKNWISEQARCQPPVAKRVVSQPKGEWSRSSREKTREVGSFVFEDGQFQIPVTFVFILRNSHSRLFHFNLRHNFTKACFWWSAGTLRTSAWKRWTISRVSWEHHTGVPLMDPYKLDPKVHTPSSVSGLQRRGVVNTKEKVALDLSRHAWSLKTLAGNPFLLMTSKGGSSQDRSLWSWGGAKNDIFNSMALRN